MAGDTVRLYTRQNDKTLLMLEHGGRILNQRVYVQLHFGDMAKHYLDCYDWFARARLQSSCLSPIMRSFPYGAQLRPAAACPPNPAP